MTSVSERSGVRSPVARRSQPAPPAAHSAAGLFAGRHPDRHRLAQPARHQLFRLQPDAQSGDPDRAGDACPDVRHHRQRPRPVDRHLRRLRRLRHRDLAARGAAVRRADPARLDRRLCRARRPHLPAQHPVDRRHARHELRLARPGHPAPAQTGRQRTRLAACGSWPSSRPSCRCRSCSPSSSPSSPRSA